MLKDILPSSSEIAEAVKKVDNEMFRKEYGEVFKVMKSGVLRRGRNL